MQQPGLSTSSSDIRLLVARNTWLSNTLAERQRAKFASCRNQSCSDHFSHRSVFVVHYQFNKNKTK